MKVQLQNPTFYSKNETARKVAPQPQTGASLNTPKNVTFKGLFDPLTMFLRWLSTNQAWGANFVDLAFMVIPRTAVDFTRGPEAGTETMRREATGTVNHSLIGAYGLTAATLMALGINNHYKVKANKLFAGGENLDLMAAAMHKQIKSNLSEEELLDNYFREVASKIKGLCPEKGKENPWKFLKDDPEAFDEVVKTLKAEAKLNGNNLSKDGEKYLTTVITRALGSESNVIFDGTKPDNTSLKLLLDNIHKVTKAFRSKEVIDSFKEVDNFVDSSFLKKLKGLNKKTSIIGLGIAAALGCCIQPFNMYLTRKKTGKTGFVGVEGREPDKSGGFKALKVVTAGAFGAMVLSVLGVLKDPKLLLNKIQFQGGIPTLNQFKLVYGITIMSRLLSSRDKNELREATTKDTLGFLNWLVLGNFVAKLAAAGLEKFIKDPDNALSNYSELEHGKGLWKRITKSSIKSHSEILQTELKKAGKLTTENGKALSVWKMLKHAPGSAKTKIAFINIAQLAGYAYSGLVLGIGIPKLNIFITKNVEKNKKAKEKALSSEKSEKA